MSEIVDRLRDELRLAYDNLTAVQATSNRLLEEARSARAALANAQAEHDLALRVVAVARTAREAGFCGAALADLVDAIADFAGGGERVPPPRPSLILAHRLETGFAEGDTE